MRREAACIPEAEDHRQTSMSCQVWASERRATGSEQRTLPIPLEGPLRRATGTPHSPHCLVRAQFFLSDFLWSVLARVSCRRGRRNTHHRGIKRDMPRIRISRVGCGIGARTCLQFFPYRFDKLMLLPLLVCWCPKRGNMS